MPDGYDRDRDRIADNNIRGRVFENGTYLYFRDRENGYEQQSRVYETPEGRIQFDKVKADQGRTFSIEDKSGRMEGRKDEKQLRALRVILETDKKHQHMLRSVEGEYVSKECQRLIDGLKKDFKDRFTHKEISRTEARTIWALGVDLERSKQITPPGQGKQLELPGVGEKAREQKAQELQKRRDKIAVLAKAREAASKFRAVQRFQESAARGRADAPQRIDHERQAHEQARQARAVSAPGREAAERVAQEMAARLGLSRDDQHTAVARETESVSAQAEREARDKEAREQLTRADTAQTAYMQNLVERGIPPEIARLQGYIQAPVIAHERDPGHTEAPTVQRGGRGDEGRGIERARS
ncbi:hypothetical protein [Nocardia arthritidis]|uniref:Uncharacterized protein n=1 Tax=Nocardia arthritidis TaxID=228602 RepID=A0A6G9Y4P7_9NOCA|nr:hypothetical protein [Nocardia arthritidis]QIS08205.1 hypothetical protein F5544_01410 [Nocardia arthritidis]